MATATGAPSAQVAARAAVTQTRRRFRVLSMVLPFS
jgi:hypothetical protein